MALSDEQRSLLQLLLSGGQGYDDIASLLGVPSDDVRLRARAALTELGGSDPDAQVALTDYLLGQADPIGRADAVRHIQNDPDAHALATRVSDQLRLLSPNADLPVLPEPRGGRRAAAPSVIPSSGGPSPTVGPAPATAGPSLRERLGAATGDGDPQRRKIAIAAGLAALLVIAVVIGVFVFGGDDGGGGDSSATTSTPTDEDLVIVPLGPLADGSDAGGQAVFAQAQDQPVLQINLTGLPASGKDQSYIVWLYNSDRVAFPLARDSVGKDGNLTGAAAIPQQILPLLAQFGCIDVSLASNQQTQQALQSAVNGNSLPQHSGETVLRGQIPAGPGQDAATGADADCNANAQAAADAAGGAGGAGAAGGAGGGAGAGQGGQATTP